MATYSLQDIVEVGLLKTGVVDNEQLDKFHNSQAKAQDYMNDNYYKSQVQQAEDATVMYLNMLEGKLNEMLAAATDISDNPLLKMLSSKSQSVISEAVKIKTLLTMIPTNMSYIPSFSARASELFPSIKELAKAQWMNVQMKSLAYLDTLKELEPTTETLIELLQVLADEIWAIADSYCLKYTGFTLQELIVMTIDGIQMYKAWKAALRAKRQKGSLSIEASIDTDVLKQDMLNWLYAQADSLYNGFIIINMIEEIKAAIKNFSNMKVMTPENIEEGISQFEMFMGFLDELGINQESIDRMDSMDFSNFISINGIKNELTSKLQSFTNKDNLLATAQDLAGRASNSVTLNVVATAKTMNARLDIYDVELGILKLTLYGDPNLPDNKSDVLSALKNSDLFKNSTCQSILDFSQAVFDMGYSGDDAMHSFPAKDKSIGSFTILVKVEDKPESVKEDYYAAHDPDPDVVSIQKYDIKSLAMKLVHIQDTGKHEHVTIPFIGLLYKYLVTLNPILSTIGKLITNYRINKNRVRTGMNLQLSIDHIKNLVNKWKHRKDEGNCVIDELFGFQTYTIRKRNTYNKLIAAGIIPSTITDGATKMATTDLSVTNTRKLIANLNANTLDRDKQTKLFIQLDDEEDGTSDGMNLYVDNEFGFVVYVDSDKDEMDTEIGRCVRDGEKAFDYINPEYPANLPGVVKANKSNKDLLLGFRNVSDIKSYLRKINYDGTLQEYLGNNGLSVSEISDVMSGKYDKDKTTLSDKDKDFLKLFNQTLNQDVKLTGEGLDQSIDFSSISACDFSKNRDYAFPYHNGISSLDDLGNAIDNAMSFIYDNGLTGDGKRPDGLSDQDFINSLLKERITGNHAIIEFADDCIADDAVEYMLNIEPGQEIDNDTILGMVEQEGKMRPLKSIFTYGRVRERDGEVEHIFAHRCSRHFILDDFCVGSNINFDIAELEDFNEKFKKESDLYEFIKDNLCHSVLPDILTNRHNRAPSPLLKFMYKNGLKIYADWEEHYEDTVDKFFEELLSKDYKKKPNKAAEKAAAEIKACGVNKDKQQAVADKYINKRKEFLEKPHNWKKPAGGLINLYNNFKDKQEKCMGDYKFKDCSMLGITYYPELFKYLNPNNTYSTKYRRLLSEIISIRNASEQITVSDMEDYIIDLMKSYNLKSAQPTITKEHTFWGVRYIKTDAYPNPLVKMHNHLGDTTDVGKIMEYLTNELDTSKNEYQVYLNHLTNLYCFYVENKAITYSGPEQININDVRDNLDTLLKKYGYQTFIKVQGVNEELTIKNLCDNPLDDMFENLGSISDDYEISEYLDEHLRNPNLSDEDNLAIMENYDNYLEFKNNKYKQETRQAKVTKSGLYKLTIQEKEKLNKFWNDILIEYKSAKSINELIDELKDFAQPKYAEWPTPVDITIDGQQYKWYLFEPVYSNTAVAKLEDETWDDNFLNAPLPGEPDKIPFTEQEALDALNDRGLDLPPKTIQCTDYAYWVTYWAIGTLVNLVPGMWATGLMLPVPLIFIPGPLISICLGVIFIKELDMLLVLGLGIRIPFNIKPMIQYVALSDKPRNVLIPITMAIEQIKQIFQNQIRTLEMGVTNVVQMYIDQLEDENKRLTTEIEHLERQSEELASIEFPGWNDLRQEIEGKLGGLDVRQHVDRLAERFEYAKRQKDQFKKAIEDAGDNQAAIEQIRNRYYNHVDVTSLTNMLTQKAVDEIYNE